LNDCLDWQQLSKFIVGKDDVAGTLGEWQDFAAFLSFCAGPARPPTVFPLHSEILHTVNNCEKSTIADKEYRARIFKRLWGPGIDSKELIPPVYVARRAGTITLFLLGS
jgi:hypothetical protein